MHAMQMLIVIYGNLSRRFVLILSFACFGLHQLCTCLWVLLSCIYEVYLYAIVNLWLYKPHMGCSFTILLTYITFVYWYVYW